MSSWWRRGRKEADGVEAQVVERAKALGGFALKVMVAGLVGFPDRIVVLPDRPWARPRRPRVGFLELKRVGEEPRPEQHWWLERLRGMGFVANWASSGAMVDNFFKELTS